MMAALTEDPEATANAIVMDRLTAVWMSRGSHVIITEFWYRRVDATVQQI
jgi:hypothetical protein